MKYNSYSVELGDVKLCVQQDEYGSQIDGKHVAEFSVKKTQRIGKFVLCDKNNRSIPAFVERGEEPNEYVLYLNGEVIRVQILSDHDERIRLLRKNTASVQTAALLVTAPMPGLIKQILVEEGDVVEKGKPLCILEAMKMENEIKSPMRLVVKRIITNAGNAVEKSAPLIELQPAS